MPVNRAQTRGFEYVSGFGEGVTPRCDREQVVFRYASDRCPDDEFHIPDAPVRAFRDDRGRVQLMLASRHTRRMIGSDLASVAVDPAHRVVLPSHDEPEVSSYDNLEWIASLYTTDGRTIHALVHNEYQGWKHAPEECETEVACWFNAITLATSTDGGERYVHRPAPEHRIAGFPRRYVPNTGPVGYFMPSNIVARDGWCYALVRALNGPRDDPAYPDQPRGDCLIRSADPSDPHSWRGWDGSEFAVAFDDPYRDAAVEGGRVCRPVSSDPPRDGGDRPQAEHRAGEMTESLTYNTHFGCFLLVGVSWKPALAGGDPVWGIYYSLSPDLVQWSERRLLARAFPYYLRPPDPARPHAILYPSLLDPASPDRCFATTGRDNELYFTVFHFKRNERGRMAVDGKNRDLVKIAIRFD